MNMNIKVRLKQKWFWLTLIPLLLLLADNVVQLVGTVQAMTIGDMLYDSAVMEVLMRLVVTVFNVLALVGFPVDMTTEGYGDSLQALQYDKPKDDFEDVLKVDKKEIL